MWLNHTLVQKGKEKPPVPPPSMHKRCLSEVEACNEVKMAQRPGHQFILGPGSGQRRSQAAC